MTRTITRISPNISYLNRIPNGVSEGLKRAVCKAADIFSEDTAADGRTLVSTVWINTSDQEKRARESAAAASWFRSEYDKDQRDFGAGAFDVWEIAPLGRYNDSAGQWRWPTREEFDGPIAEGFERFLMDERGCRVRASFGCPRKRLLGSDRRDFRLLPPCDWQFDDTSSRGPLVTKWLMKFGERYGKRGAVLETVLTDNPSNPRLATRFVTFPGYESVVQRVRASIVQVWVDRIDHPNGSPIGRSPLPGDEKLRWDDENRLPLRGVRASLYLPSKDCETMTAATLARVLPLFVDCSIQGVIPDAHMQAVREWRDAGPVRNTEGVR